MEVSGTIIQDRVSTRKIQRIVAPSLTKEMPIKGLFDHPNRLSEEMVCCMKNIFISLADSSNMSSKSYSLDMHSSHIYSYGDHLDASLWSLYDWSAVSSKVHSPQRVMKFVENVFGFKLDQIYASNLNMHKDKNVEEEDKNAEGKDKNAEVEGKKAEEEDTKAEGKDKNAEEDVKEKVLSGETMEQDPMEKKEETIVEDKFVPAVEESRVSEEPAEKEPEVEEEKKPSDDDGFEMGTREEETIGDVGIGMRNFVDSALDYMVMRWR
ncbi:hypothetical protein IFM89_023263 [Coptis chinensis]|uniref:Uncharacterized protein n=1 Tax=Coptis chinensis TaxID=261450 RepID=A0A835I5W6_9MAGN|nr:hypothetical protein IFM89_023263 [Coptis chinensis]